MHLLTDHRICVQHRVAKILDSPSRLLSLAQYGLSYKDLSLHNRIREVVKPTAFVLLILIKAFQLDQIHTHLQLFGLNR